MLLICKICYRNIYKIYNGGLHNRSWLAWLNKLFNNITSWRYENI